MRLEILHREVILLLQRLCERVLAIEDSEHRCGLLLELRESGDHLLALLLHFLQAFLLLGGLLCGGVSPVLCACTRTWCGLILCQLLVDLSGEIDHVGLLQELELHLEDLLLIAAPFLQELEQREEKMPVEEWRNGVCEVIGHAREWLFLHGGLRED